MPILDAVLATVQSEFSDLPDVQQLTHVTLRMVMALVLGAVIGWHPACNASKAGLGAEHPS